MPLSSLCAWGPHVNERLASSCTTCSLSARARGKPPPSIAVHGGIFLKSSMVVQYNKNPSPQLDHCRLFYASFNLAGTKNSDIFYVWWRKICSPQFNNELGNLAHAENRCEKKLFPYNTTAHDTMRLGSPPTTLVIPGRKWLWCFTCLTWC